MKARSAQFVTSAADPTGYPPEDLAEVAFAGRSNVGKSTLINTLVGVPRLARTSNTPGRTRLLNWFRVEPQKGAAIALVDLPGYGFAKVPREMRESWRPMVESFLVKRSVLRHVFVLVDARRGVQTEERELFEWLDSEGIASTAVVTKCDKLPKSKRKPIVEAIRRELQRPAIATSSESHEGLQDLWRVITKATA